MNTNLFKRALSAILLTALLQLTPFAWAQDGAAANASASRTGFTSAINDREPVDSLSSLSNEHRQVYFFSELHGLNGQSVIHRWQHNGQVMAEIKFEVGANRWRVWSSKNLLPEWTGEWRVSVIDGAGNTLGESTLDYTAAQP